MSTPPEYVVGTNNKEVAIWDLLKNIKELIKYFRSTIKSMLESLENTNEDSDQWTPPNKKVFIKAFTTKFKKILKDSPAMKS